MKKFLSLLILTFAFNVLATDDPQQLLILEEIQKSIVNDFELQGEMKMVVTNPTNPTNKLIDTKEDEQQGPSAGEKKVQEQLARNRAKLQELKGEKGPQLSGKEKIELLLAQKRAKIKELQKNKKVAKNDSAQSSDWMSGKQQEIDNWQDERQEQINQWEEEKKKIIAKWMEERKKFIKRIPEYKNNLTPIPIPKEEKPQPKMEVADQTSPSVTPTAEPTSAPVIKKVEMPVFSDFKIIDNAFDGPAKDQGKRPTCAAFAGIRAVEILFARKDHYQQLSEQYLFWSNKPECKSSPCSKSGSWVYEGYRNSQNSPYPDIPLEKDCPYNPDSVQTNTTQTPLISGCRNGKVQVKRFRQLNSMNEVLDAIKNNHPVVSAFKLSKNFYRNTGYVFLKDKNKTPVQMDSHSNGHALLLIGYMKLPQKQHLDQGRYCLITANSLGIGWGKGGHACLSERWIDRYKYEGIKFISVESI